MNACIAEPRAEVAATAPKIISITIPMDKIGEVIGPKGKVINTIQQETGADIAVDDDGSVGIVTIGAVEASKMEEAKARILAIVDPPKADVGATYMGRVVNITKFGAFVNILPGRDGLVHISKLGKGKRINNVEDVLTLGQEIEVVVEEIDEKGKVSLTPGRVVEPVPATVTAASSSCRRRRPASRRSWWSRLSRVAAGDRPRCRQLRRRVRCRARRRARRPRPRRRSRWRCRRPWTRDRGDRGPRRDDRGGARNRGPRRHR